MTIVLFIFFLFILAHITVNSIIKGIKSKRIFKIKKTTNKMLIVPLMFNGNTYNFMLDTGSTASHVCMKFVDEFTNAPQDIYECGENIYGASTNIMCNSYIVPNFIFCNKRKNIKIQIPLLINSSIGQSFDMINNDYNIQLYGILGMDFIDKYISSISFDKITLITKD